MSINRDYSSGPRIGSIGTILAIIVAVSLIRVVASFKGRLIGTFKSFWLTMKVSLSPTWRDYVISLQR